METDMVTEPVLTRSYCSVCSVECAEFIKYLCLVTITLIYKVRTDRNIGTTSSENGSRTFLPVPTCAYLLNANGGAF